MDNKPMPLHYAFVLGKHPELSRAEITAILPNVHLLCSTQETLILTTPTPLSGDFIDQLGGTIKIAKIELETKEIHPDVFKFLLDKKFKQKKTYKNTLSQEEQSSKIVFGMSWYGTKNIKQSLRKGLEFKKHLKTKGMRSRFVTSQDKTLSSVVVQKNRLLIDGIEFIIIEDHDRLYAGYTLAVQDFESYSLRDYGRPARDDRSGMLPPKVAQILINLTGVDKKRALLDPFCGSGTILQEAMLLGYEKIIGTDKDPRAIENTKKNIAWLKTHYLQHQTDHKHNAQHKQRRFGSLHFPMPQLIATPIERLQEYIPETSVNCIVFEGFLGPPHVTSTQLPSLILELTALYKKTFEVCSRLLNNEGIIACAIPAWQFHRQLTFLPMEKILPTNLRLQIKRGQTPRKSFLYARPNQTVCREIFLLKKGRSTARL